MVGRTKPQAKMDHSSDDFAAAEILFLKSKNSELAKALADAKLSIKQTMDERDYLQRQMLTLQMHNSELLGYITHIDQAARKSINAIVVSSNYITEIAQMAMAGMRKSDANPTPVGSLANSVDVPSPNTSKMHVVKPMIDGHVIHRPTISLRRVNETSSDEIRRVRSNPQTQNPNNNLNLDPDENNENSLYRRLSVAGPSNSRSFNDHNHTPTSDLSNDMEDDYTDEPADVPQMELSNHNRLHTIEELSESIMDNPRSEDDLSTIVNASTNSVSIPRLSTQGPLLSGVFRDVRVYLSPMQNVSQYLESLRGVTTERGKLYNSKKKHYSPRTVSLDDNNQCVVTLNASESRLDRSNSILDNANNTFEDANHSILTSTRIGNNCDDSCQLRTSDYAKKTRWPNNFEDTTINKNMCMFNNSAENGFNTCSKWMPVKENYLSQDYSTSSFHTPTMSTAYDPMEGPSTLLESSSITKEKVEALYMLGLKPRTSDESLSSKPSTPASAVLKRRERRQQDISPSKKNKSIYVTKRKLDSKMTIISTKVVNKKKSFSPSPRKLAKIAKRINVTNHEWSPLERKSVKDSFSRRSLERIERKRSLNDSIKKRNKKVKVECKEELNISPSTSESVSSVASSVANSSTKRGSKAKKKLKESRKSASPQKSPKKKRLARTKILSLKEPMLKKKLRRP